MLGIISYSTVVNGTAKQLMINKISKLKLSYMGQLSVLLGGLCYHIMYNVFPILGGVPGQVPPPYQK